MRNRYFFTVIALGFYVNSFAQLYLESGSTLTIEGTAVVHADGDVFNDGAVDGTGFLNMFNSAQTYTGNGAINNLRVSGGADVTPANSVTLGNALDVASASSLTIPTGQYVLVNGPLTNAGTFTVENSGSLVQAMGSTLSNSGTFHVRRQGTNSPTVFNYWSSPIDANVFVPGSNVYQWTPSASTQAYGDDASDPGWSAFGGSMVPGRGYASTGGGLATFSGTVNNEGVNSGNLYYREFDPYGLDTFDFGTPFNLVGNPYPCAISAMSLVLLNTHINGAIYFWDDDLSGGSGYDQSDYAVWNPLGNISPTPPSAPGAGGGGNAPNGFIASGQGFMVRVNFNGAYNAAGQSVAPLVFNNSLRTDALNMLGYSNSQFFKVEEEPSRLWIGLEGNNLYNEVLIGMAEDATEGEDRLYDALKSRGNQNISLSAVNEDFDYCIMAFPPPPFEKMIPLNVFVSEAGPYTFNSHTIEGYDGYDIFLEDRSTFTYYPMVEGTQIPFQLDAGEIHERFYLHIGSELVTGIRESEDPAMRAWIYDGMLNVNLFNFNGRGGQLEMLDMAGRRVWTSGSVVSDRFTADVSSLSRGAYLVRMISPSGIYTEKVLR